MSQAQGISSGDPDPLGPGETSPRPHGGAGPEPGSAPSSERRPAGELESTVLAALWAADAPLTPVRCRAPSAHPWPAPPSPRS